MAMQNLFLCNSKTIGCQSKLKCGNFIRKIKKPPEKLETESEKKYQAQVWQRSQLQASLNLTMEDWKQIFLDLKEKHKQVGDTMVGT